MKTLNPTDVDFFDADLRDDAASVAAGLSTGRSAVAPASAGPALTWLWSKAETEHQGA